MKTSSDELFSGRFKEDWYQYFIGRISEIEIDRGCPKGVGAYVYGMWGSKMYVCTMLLSSDFTSLDRASVFMHEARHIDGYPHTTCRSGARAGIRGACDHRISDGGSYAVSVETYAQIAKYALDVHPALKAYSRAAAVTYADEAFDTPARVDRKEGLVLLTADGRFHRILTRSGDDVELKTLGASPSVGRISPRAEQLILFPNDKTKRSGFVFPRGEGEIAQQAGELSRKYNEASETERMNVIDIHIGGRWSVQLNSSNLEFYCDYRSDRITQVPIPTGKEALGFVYPEGYNRAHSTILVQFKDGSLYEGGCQSLTQAYLKDSGRMFTIPMQRVHKAGELALGVDQSGMVYKINGHQQVPLSLQNIGSVSEIAPYSSFDFFDL